MENILRLSCSDFNEDFAKGMDFVEGALVNVSGKKKNNIILAFEEVFVNVLQYNDDESLQIAVEVMSRDGYVYVKVEDNGEKFNPLLTKDPDLSLNADDRELGGLGLFLLKKISDYIEYKYYEGKNILTFGVKIDEGN
ncbi:MAG: ATP-binding protein [Clostridiales bacterium]|nr:ATP-binding protein [Clostridiales bacterium]